MRYLVCILLLFGHALGHAQSRQQVNRGTHDLSSEESKPQAQVELSNLLQLYNEYKEGSDYARQASILADISEVQLKLKKYQDSKHTYELIEQLPDDPGTNEIKFDAYSALAFLNFTQANYTKSLEYYKRVLPQLIEDEKTAYICSTLDYIGLSFYHLDELDSAYHYLNESMRYSQGGVHPYSEAKTHNHLGVVCARLEDYTQSMNHYLAAIKFFLADSNLIQTSLVSQNIARLFAARGDWSRAEEYSDEALSLAEKANLVSYRARALSVKGDIYMKREEYDLALRTYQEALEIYKSVPIPVSAARVLRKMSEIELLSENVKAAELLIEDAISLSQGTEDMQNHIWNQLTLANIRLSQGRAASALDIAKQGLLDAKQISGASQMLEAYRILSDAHARLDKHETALQYLKSKEELEDRRIKKQQMQSMHYIEAKFNRLEQEKEISELAAENLAKDQAIQKQRSLQRTISLVALAFLLFTLLMYWFYRRQKKLSDQISQQNRVIADSLDEKENLIREIHHRVKNNLQVVSSLLNLQSKLIQDEEAKKAIKEGQNRVRSMALIHQNLYMDANNLQEIEASDYIQRLCQSLFHSYKVDADHISLETSVDDVVLDIDTIIPLGLILNELVSNSLKHAFPQGEDGSIQVSLTEDQNALVLKVADNGVGLERPVYDKKDSFGMKLIENFSRKLKANLQVISGQGTTTILTIPYASSTAA